MLRLRFFRLRPSSDRLSRLRGVKESASPRSSVLLKSESRRQVIASLLFSVFLNSQFALPLAIAQAQTAPALAAAVSEKQELAQVLASTEPAKRRLEAASAKDCRKCRISVKALDLSRVPSEDDLRRAGGMNGALSPLFNADYTGFTQAKDQELKKAGVAQGLLAEPDPRSEEAVVVKKQRQTVARHKRMTREFGQAIQEWNEHHFSTATQMLAKHLKDYPDSPWAGEAMLHLSMMARHDGRFNEAQERDEYVLSNTSNAPTDPTWDIHQKAKLQLAGLDISQGKFNGASDILRDVIANDSDWRRQTWAMYWLGNLGIYKANARQLRACGSQALSFVLFDAGKDHAAQVVGAMQPKNDEGFSLEELARLAGRFHLPMRGFRTSPEGLAALPMPLILHYDYSPNKTTPEMGPRLASTSFGSPVKKTFSHGARKVTTFGLEVPAKATWMAQAATQVKANGPETCCGAGPDPKANTNAKPARATKSAKAKVLRKSSSFPLKEAPSKASDNAGHFLIARSVNSAIGVVNLYDPQSNTSYSLTFGQLAREWGGTGLAKEGVAEISGVPKKPEVREAKRAGTLMRVAWLSPDDMKVMVGGCCGAPCRQLGLGASGVSRSGCATCAAPSWGVNPTNMNFFMQQTPLSYQTPVGPDVNLSLSYNSYDSSNRNTPFGNKWSFNYGTYPLESLGGDCAGKIGGPGSGSIGLIQDYHPTPKDWERMRRQKSGLRSAEFEQGRATGGFRTVATQTVEQPGTITLFMPDGRQDSYAPDGSGGYISELGNYNTLSKQGSSYVLLSPTGEQFVYAIPTGTGSLQPFLTEIRDAQGYSVRFSYDSEVRLTTITDAMGQVTRLIYDATGHVTRVDDPFGRHAFFSYDAAGNMTQIVNVEGDTFSFGASSNQFINSLTTAQGGWSFKTEGPGKANVQAPYPASDADMGDNVRITIANPLGAKEEYYYDSLGTFRKDAYGYAHENYKPVTWYVDANHYVSNTPTYNNSAQNVPKTMWTSGAIFQGQPKVDIINFPDGTAEGILYGSNGLPQTVVDQRGFQTSFQYNAMGRVTAVKDTKNRVTRIGYDGNGVDATSVVNARGVTVAQVAYNSTHLPTSVTDAAGHTTAMSYTPWGAPMSVIDTANNTTFYSYDPASKRIASVVYNGATMAAYTYDGRGNVTSATDAVGRTSTYSYNPLGAVTAANYPDGSKTESLQTCCGLPGMTTDRSGRKSYYDYDPLKRLVRVQDAGGATLQMDYWPGGQLRQIIDAKGNTTRFLYDDANRLYRKIYADGTYEGYAYDVRGGQTSYRDATGQVTTTQFDQSDDLVKIAYPNQASVQFSYDELDRPTAMQDGLGTTKWNYDDLNRLKSEDGPFANDTVSYGYDTLNRLTGMSVNNTDATTYGYDSLSRLSGVTSSGGTFAAAGSWNFAYDPSQVGVLDLPTQMNAPNGTKTLFGYDGLERLTGLQHQKSSDNSVLSSFGYGFDNAQKKDARQSLFRQMRGTDNVLGAAQTIAFSYDATDQLEGETSNETTPLVSLQHRYDLMGNRTLWGDGKTQRQTQSVYNTLNQLTQSKSYDTSVAPATLLSTTDYGYDLKGNLTGVQTQGQPSGTTYSYDDTDRLTAITLAGSNKTEFAYDGMSRLRISRYSTWNGTAWALQNEKRRVYDGMDIVQERDGNNAVTANLTRMGNIGGILARSTSTGSLYFHCDGNGNVAQLTDGAGAVVGTYTYDAYGGCTLAGTAAQNNPYRYSSKENIGGLYSFGLRFYSPGMGRWLNRDPLVETGGLNLYGFNNASPTNFVDPTGACALLVTGAIGAVAGGLIGGGVAWWKGEDTGAILRAAGRGAIIGGIAGLTGGLAGGAVAGALGGGFWAGVAGGVAGSVVGDVAGQGLELGLGWRCSYDWKQTAFAGLIGGAMGGISGAKWLCFTAGTPVVLANGATKVIEQLKVGDKVLARDEVTGKTEAKKITRTFKRQVEATLVLSFSNGDKIECTKEHPFYVEHKGFTPAAELGIGTSIVTRAGPAAKLTQIEVKNQTATVYNFEVEDSHSYFVGNHDGGLWVHNTCAGDHHFFLRSLGSKAPYGHSSLTWLNSLDHTNVHEELNIFLREETKTVGGNVVDMLPRRGNPGSIVQSNFTSIERQNALDAFYQAYAGGAYYQNFLNELSVAHANGWVR